MTSEKPCLFPSVRDRRYILHRLPGVCSLAPDTVVAINTRYLIYVYLEQDIWIVT